MLSGPRPNPSDQDMIRFWKNVDKNGPIPTHKPEIGQCWIWMLSKNEHGYGQMRISQRPVKAHRVAFFSEHGEYPYPHGLHHCDNPACVRPSHIFAGHPIDNSNDKLSKSRQARGTGHGRSRLTESDVIEIRAACKAGEHQKDIGIRFGVDGSHISRINSGVFWSHIETVSDAAGAPVDKL